MRIGVKVEKRKIEEIATITMGQSPSGNSINETEGVEYHFCSKREFEYMIKQNKLIEYRSYNTLLNGKEDTWYYGILKEDLDLENERYVVILDLNGAKSFYDYYGKENCHCVYIEAMNEVRTERAKKRGSFDETEWNRRLKADEEDFEIITANHRNPFRPCGYDKWEIKHIYHLAHKEVCITGTKRHKVRYIIR